MLLNLTLNPSTFFGEKTAVVDFKREEAWDMLAMFWSDTVCNYITLSKKIADLAHESGIKKAVIDVPTYAVSILETELLLYGIIPVHYYSGQFVEINSDILLENLYNILERQTDIDYEKSENVPSIIQIQENTTLEVEDVFKDTNEVTAEVTNKSDFDTKSIEQEDLKDKNESEISAKQNDEPLKKSFKIQRNISFGKNVNLQFKPKS